MKDKPYPHYKASPISWLDRMPQHWDAASLRWLSRRYAGGTPDKGNVAYWEDGEIPWLNSGSVNDDYITQPSELITREGFANSSAKWIPKGALVMALAGQGKTKGMVAQLGIQTTCNQSMAALIPNRRLVARYLYWWLTANYQNLRNLAGGEARDGLNLDLLGSVSCPLPMVLEQKAIVRFLDTKTREIDSLIAKKRDLIEKLKEKRNALITCTVTRGLPPEVAKAVGIEPNPKMKDAGVQWLGDVPTHWKVKQLKWAIMFQRGHDLPSEQREEGSVPLVTSAGVSDTHNVAVAKGPGIVTGRYGTIGQFHLINEDYWPLNTTLYSIDLYGNSPSFLRYMLEHLSPLVVLHSVKSAVPGVDRNDLHPTRVALPPVVEQHVIAAYLDRETRRLDNLAAKVESATTRLTEYRQALITSAVTGQIDVRHWQAPALQAA